MVVDHCLSCKELTALQSCKNIYSLYKILRHSRQTPGRLLRDSREAPWSPCGLPLYSRWSPPGDRSYLQKNFRAQSDTAQKLIEDVVEKFELTSDQERAFRIIANHAVTPGSEQ